MRNDKFIQLHGPFKKNTELTTTIKKNFPDFVSIKNLGVQTAPTHICNINGQSFEIGKTEILEFNEVAVKSLYFEQDEPSTTLVNCLLT